jgi:hypothetical protein
MTFHAMRDGGEIEAPLDGISQHCLREGRLGTGNVHVLHGRFVDRRLDLVAEGWNGTDVGYDGVEIVRRQYLVKDEGHLRRHLHTIRPNALAQEPLQVGSAPRADPRVAIGRDVGALDRIGVLVPSLRAAGKSLFHDQTGRRAWGVAIIAGHHRIDEILTALDWRLRRRTANRRNQNSRVDRRQSYARSGLPVLTDSGHRTGFRTIQVGSRTCRPLCGRLT